MNFKMCFGTEVLGMFENSHKVFHYSVDEDQDAISWNYAYEFDSEVNGYSKLINYKTPQVKLNGGL